MYFIDEFLKHKKIFFFFKNEIYNSPASNQTTILFRNNF